MRAERQRLGVELEQLGWGVLPSQANFILATCPDGRGRDAYLGLKEQGILSDAEFAAAKAKLLG